MARSFNKILVLVLHHIPGDPDNAAPRVTNPRITDPRVTDPRVTDPNFEWLGTSSQVLELVFVSGKSSLDQQFSTLYKRYLGHKFAIAPLFLGRGYHVTNELMPALSNLSARGADIEMLEVWGESKAFVFALRSALNDSFVARVLRAGRLDVFAAAASTTALRINALIELLRPELRQVKKQWHSRISDFLKTPQIGATLTIRNGRMAQAIAQDWDDRLPLFQLLTPDRLRRSIQQWCAESPYLGAQDFRTRMSKLSQQQELRYG